MNNCKTLVKYNKSYATIILVMEKAGMTIRLLSGIKEYNKQIDKIGQFKYGNDKRRQIEQSRKLMILAALKSALWAEIWCVTTQPIFPPTPSFAKGGIIKEISINEQVFSK